MRHVSLRKLRLCRGDVQFSLSLFEAILLKKILDSTGKSEIVFFPFFGNIGDAKLSSCYFDVNAIASTFIISPVFRAFNLHTLPSVSIRTQKSKRTTGNVLHNTLCNMST